MVDPYREWLGISDERRPPTLYQLLGLPPNVADPRAIEAAVKGQLAKVQPLVLRIWAALPARLPDGHSAADPLYLRSVI